MRGCSKLCSQYNSGLAGRKVKWGTRKSEERFELAQEEEGKRRTSAYGRNSDYKEQREQEATRQAVGINFRFLSFQY